MKKHLKTTKTNSEKGHRVIGDLSVCDVRLYNSTYLKQ